MLQDGVKIKDKHVTKIRKVNKVVCRKDTKYDSLRRNV